MTLIVGEEKRRRSDRLNQLDRICEEKETALRDKRTELKRLAEQSGIAEEKGTSLKELIAVEQFSGALRELSQARNDARRIKGEMDVRKAMVHAVGGMEFSQFELDTLAQSDQDVAEVLLPALAQVKKQLLEAGVNAQRAKTPPDVAELRRRLAEIEAHIDDRLQELKEQVRASRRANIEAEILALECYIMQAVQLEEELSKEMERSRAVVERLRASSVDLDMLRTQIQQLEKILDSVAEEREKQKVEVNSEPRVTVVQPSDVPESPSNTELRAGLAVVTASILLCFPLGCVIFVRLARRLARLLDRL